MTATHDGSGTRGPVFDPLVPRPIDRPTTVAGSDAEAMDGAKIFAAPDDPADWPAWREAITAWRTDALARYRHDGAAYHDPDTAWASRCFSVALTWLWDERLFDHAAQRFTPERWLAGTAAFGGFDAVVLWHAYPIIGIDERDQYDFYRDVPGLADLVAWFHAHGLRAFVDYNPWDVRQHAVGWDVRQHAVGWDVRQHAVGWDVRQHAVETDVAGSHHAAATAAVAVELGADGVFLDTMKEGGADLVSALRATRPPMVLEGESKVSLARIADHQISWAQWFADTEAPGVMRAHWFERGHMQHHTRRWNRDHSDELQSAWMNGVGVVVWDAVFGSWVGWNERDRATLRAMVRAQRALADVLLAGEWTPLVDAAAEALDAGVFVSRWRSGRVTLWTVVDRGPTDYTGPVLDASVVGGGDGAWLDVTGGRPLAGSASGLSGAVVPARGLLGIVHIDGDPAAELLELVTAAEVDPGSSDATFPARAEVRVPPPLATADPAPDAIALAGGWHRFRQTYRVRETGLYDGAPYVEEWKPLPPRLHGDGERIVDVMIGDVGREVMVAAREVTGAEFARFLDESDYGPVCVNRLDLARTVDPDGPARFVGLADARAYAAWVGARLPTEFEWQLAAADPSFRRLAPAVWNWTESEHADGVTRYVMLKGGSAYRPTGSDWYFDGGEREPEFVAKLLLAGLGVERSSRIGFRLAWDVRS